MSFVLAICLLAPATKTLAQGAQNSATNVIYLEQNEPIVDLENRALLFYPKIGSNVSIKDVIRLYRSKSPLFKPAGSLNTLINNQSVFAVIPVVNSTNMSTWSIELNSPTLFPGFSFENIKLWDGQSGYALSTFSTNNSGLTFALPPRASKPLIVELANFQGIVGSFSLKLKQAGAETQKNSTTLINLVAISFVIGFLLLMVYFSISQFFVLHIIRFLSGLSLFGFLYLLMADQTSTLTANSLPLLFGVFLVCQSLIIRNGVEYTSTAKLLVNGALGASIITLLCAIIPFAGLKFEFLSLFFSLACLITFFLLTIATLSHYFSTKERISLLIATTILSVVSFIMLLIYTNLIPTTELALNTFSYASVFFLIAASSQALSSVFSNRGQDYQPVAAPSNSALTKKVKEVKESYDHARLLQVLESERTAMKALQAREATQVDAMRHAKQVADEANNAKSAFLAMVSHEIRTPMTGVLGMVRFLKNTSLDQTQTEHVDTIEESGNTIMGLLNDILDFEKIETGQMSLEIIDFNLYRLMESIYSLAKGYASDKQLDIHLNIDDDISQIVKGDPTRLRQILLNLINNAIKFTQNGSVTITLKSISNQNNQAQIYFSVEDSGIGIEKEAQRNLFNPFKQADKSTSRKYGGSGLGLAISQKLVGLMNSAINVKSALGEGSTFFFTLSLPVGDISNTETPPSVEKTNVKPQKKTSKPTTDGQSFTHRALVVEDNAINQKVISGFIKEKEFESVLAGTGEDALTILQSDTNFDIILMDIEMPGISGVETTQRIRGELGLPSQAFPIIALTGNTHPDDIQNYLNVGMNGFLAKPINAESLHAILDEIKEGTYQAEEAQIRPEAKQMPKHISKPTEKKSMPIENKDTDMASMDTGLSLDDDDDEKNYSSAVEFDEAQLASLKNTLQESDLKDMIDELIEKMHSISNDIKTAITDENYDLIKAKGHEIKGMCANFGLTKVADQAEELERAAQIQDMGATQTAYKDLGNTIIRGEERLKTWMAS